MEPQTTDLESLLAKLAPAAPGGGLTQRLEQAMDGVLTETDAATLAWESRMRGIRPAAVSPRVSAAFLAAVADLAFPADDNLIPFPQPAVRRDTVVVRRPRWQAAAAAAAVALLGGASALLMPLGGKAPAVAQSGTPVPASSPAAEVAGVPAASRGFVPASFNRGVSDVRENGLVWDKSGRACRVVRVVYTDRASMTNARGERVEVEQPRVEYLLVPEKID